MIGTHIIVRTNADEQHTIEESIFKNAVHCCINQQIAHTYATITQYNEKQQCELISPLS